MVKSYVLDRICQKGQIRNQFHACRSKLFKSFVLVAALIFAGTVSAQKVAQSQLNCTSSNRCTSKDLFVQDVFVDLPQCTTCGMNQTVTGPLKMTIYNGTSSVRTSFSLYGTLSSGATVTVGGTTVSGNIFICVGPITVKQGPQTFTVGTISFTCGQDLTLSNNFLAWTDASGTTDDRCNTYSQATTCSDIAPKCGTAATITIRAPLTASSSTVVQPCIGAPTGGSLKVKPVGGARRYNIVIAKGGSGACPTTPVQDSVVATATKVDSLTTGTTLAAGVYCIYVTDSVGCKYTFKDTLEGVQCCQAPPKPCITATTVGICSNGTVSLTISNAVDGDKYYFVRGSTKDSAVATSSGTVTFTGITPSTTDFKVYGVDVKNGTSCTSDTSRCSDLDQTCVSASAASRVANPILTPAASETKVIAAPNPFNDRIRFSVKPGVSGNGSLELYNMLGQRIKTVFQGRVEAGKIQTIEYSVPDAQRANLIYLFRVGNQKTSGKLIGLK